MYSRTVHVVHVSRLVLEDFIVRREQPGTSSSKNCSSSKYEASNGAERLAKFAQRTTTTTNCVPSNATTSCVPSNAALEEVSDAPKGVIISCFLIESIKLTQMPPVMFRFHPNRDFEAFDNAMVVTDGTKTSASLLVIGEPVSQPRARFARRFLRRGIFPFVRFFVFDPASAKKAAFQLEVRNAFTGIGASPFPLFGNGDKLKVTVAFHVFDARKDIDNLLKFFLDALQGVIFKNDQVIFEVVAKKIRATRNSQFTEFEVENIVE
jgi:Holliday junction resolvase RusA-like endonuclease